MKCPKCNRANDRSEIICQHCGAPLDDARTRKVRTKRTPAMAVAHGVMWVFFALVALVFFGLLFYRAYFWYDAWRLETMYERDGNIAPEIVQTVLDNGLPAHVVTFYGNDGDCIFIKELNKSYQIIGRFASIEIPDSNWFGPNPDDIESAIVTLTPMLYTEGGEQRPLPVLTLNVDTPESPLTLLTPTSTFEQVSTSIYSLSIKVAPKSTVLINGEDQTDMVDYEGVLTCNVSVYPVGDNIISILVATPNHKQTRYDVNLYRPYQEINLEPSLNLPKRTNRATIDISGKVDPGATLTVDTAHEEGSIVVKESGDFTFRAKLEIVGDNIITFRASQEGKQDSVVSVVVYYVPTLEAYSRKAWKMSYAELALYYETWQGRIFLCDGIVTEVMQDGEEQTIVMDVNNTGEGAPQYVLLTNYSSIGTPEVGSRYHGYADVTGSRFYNNVYCPVLACRYLIKK